MLPRIRVAVDGYVTKEQFFSLMMETDPQNTNILFDIYDYRHRGNVCHFISYLTCAQVNWDEYICILLIIINGTLKERLGVVFRYFRFSFFNSILELFSLELF